MLHSMKSELDFLYEKQLQTRIRIAYTIAIVVFGLLFLRLWFLQIVRGATYRELSENNRIRIQHIKAPRGFILDSAGRILAGNRPSFDISLVPQDTPDPAAVLNRLSKLLKTGATRLQQRLEQARGRPPFEPVKLITDVSRDTLGLVLSHRLDLPGVVVESTPVRSYPLGSLACHLLGHLGEIDPAELSRPDFRRYKIGSFVGKSGIERAMEQYLTGTDGGYQTEVNAVGYKINIMGQIDPIPAKNVTLTINAELQKVAEDALGNRSGAIVALDPRTGRVLAMASSPVFDPNLFSLGISSQDWSLLIDNPDHPLMNRCTQATHPPGSTYKIITAAAALEEGLVSPETSFTCTGSYVLGNRSYHCWKRSGHGSVSLMRGVVESCDVYFYHLGALLGPDILARYASGFGFGRKTGIASCEENPGLIPTSVWYRKRYGISWQAGESLSIAIGQGSNQVTPLQLVVAYAAIANGGTLFRPFCIEQIDDVNGNTVRQFPPRRAGTIPLSEEYRNALMDCLRGAVNRVSGTGTRASIPGIDVSGKTGTAQVVSISNKDATAGEDIPSDHAWFAGYAPAVNARIAIIVLIEHGGHGGSAAAPVARMVLSRFFELEGEGSV